MKGRISQAFAKILYYYGKDNRKQLALDIANRKITTEEELRDAFKNAAAKVFKNDEKQDDENICVLCLCESQHLYLRPNQLYRFVVCPDCEECKELASHYPVQN